MCVLLIRIRLEIRSPELKPNAQKVKLSIVDGGSGAPEYLLGCK
jgi:hypothetical protein